MKSLKYILSNWMGRHFIILLLVIYNYLYFILFRAYIPDKFIEFFEFNKILKWENSIMCAFVKEHTLIFEQVIADKT